MARQIEILAVDDRPENLLALDGLLQEPWLRIVKAQSGNEALSLMLDHDFALVLLDVQMPEMDGFETATLMRSLTKTRDTPIIFVTAISKEDKHIFKGYESGAVDYLCKPFEPEILQSKVKVFCDLYLAKMQAEMDRKLLETTLHSIGDGVIATDTTGLITFINQTAAKLTGWAQHEAVGKDLHSIFQITDPEGNALEIQIPAAAPDEEKEALKIEGCLASRTSFLLPIEYSSDSIIGDNGQVLGLIMAFNDIHVRKEAEEEKANLQEQLRQAQKMEAIGTLAGGIAHDFNNILTPIVGYAELTMNDLAPDSGLRQNLAELLKASFRARDLVKQILTFSRQQEGTLTTMQLQPVLKEGLKLLRSTLPTSIELQHNIGLDCGPAQVDPTQIHQVLLNLCTNAYHAMKGGGGVIKVEFVQVELKEEDLPVDRNSSGGKYLKLTVEDSGCGMDQDTMSKIFDPYFTTKEVGEGTGMGLSVVHGIVKKYQGFMEVESEVGKGSAFHVFLPVSTENQGPHEADNVSDLPVGNGHILLVDDEEQVLILIHKMLENFGYDVTMQGDSSKALEVFQADPMYYDMVITDHVMPGMTGRQLTEKILAIRPDIPVVLLTGYGYGELDSEDDAHAKGFTDFIKKPVMMRDLIHTVNRAFKNKTH
jgi:PAS domain S-box-containing protein